MLTTGGWYSERLIADASDGDLLHAPAAARNAPAILDALRSLLAPAPPAGARVLELAAGSGQHAAAFSSALAEEGVISLWQATDASPAALRSIAAARRRLAGAAAAAMAPPASLDLLAPPAAMPGGDASYDLVLAVNVLHIAPAAATPALMAIAASALRPGGRLAVYGPFRVDGRCTTESNAAFDAKLRAEDAAWGLRDVADVAAAAAGRGLALTERRDMPSNNFICVFEKRG